MHAERDVATAGRWAVALLAAVLLLSACGDDPVDPDPSCAEAEPLPFGISRDSVLWTGDPLLDGSFINYYAVFPEATGTLVVEMAAEVPTGDRPAVDPFLYLWSAELGDPLAQGFDESGEGPLLRVARLSADVGPGCYRIGASGWPDADQGLYTIRADLIPSP